MKHSPNYLDEKRIELVDDQDQERFKKAKPLSVVSAIWQHLIAIFTKQPELQVQQRSDCFGNTWWEAYDRSQVALQALGLKLICWHGSRLVTTNNLRFEIS